jgi:hypothetical protein
MALGLEAHPHKDNRERKATQITIGYLEAISKPQVAFKALNPADGETIER